MIYLEIASKISLPLLAIFAAYISYRQYKINKMSLKEVLFERRLLCYQNMMQALFMPDFDGNLSHEAYAAFLHAQKTSDFIFGDDVEDLTSSIVTELSDWRQLERRISRKIESSKCLEPDLEYEEMIEKQDNYFNELKEWKTSIRSVMAPYITLGDIK